MTDEYVRKAQVVRVIDGDTFEMSIHLGYRIYAREIIRLRGYDAAEMRWVGGAEARQRSADLLSGAKEILVKSYKDQMSFERWIGDVWIDGVDLSELLKRPVSS